MAFGAEDHQKEKVMTAPAVMYSEDSLCSDDARNAVYVLSRQERESGPQSTLKYSSQRHKQGIELQAKQMWCNQAPRHEVVRFLRQVPWHIMQASSESRPTQICQAPQSTKVPAYVIFGAFMHGGVVGVTRVT